MIRLFVRLAAGLLATVLISFLFVLLAVQDRKGDHVQRHFERRDLAAASDVARTLERTAPERRAAHADALREIRGVPVALHRRDADIIPPPARLLIAIGQAAVYVTPPDEAGCTPDELDEPPGAGRDHRRGPPRGPRLGRKGPGPGIDGPPGHGPGGPGGPGGPKLGPSRWHRPGGGARDGCGPKATYFLPLVGSPLVAVIGPLQRFTPPPRRLPLRVGELLVAMVPVLILIGGVAFLMARPVVRDLRRLERAAAAVTDGKMDARADVKSGGALGSFAHRFNRMADSLAGALRRQRSLIQAVSHELRTPIARIRLGVEMLSLAKDDEARRKRIDAVDEDIDELDGLVAELLTYLQYDETDVPAELRTRFRVDEALSALVARLRTLAPDIGVELDGPVDGEPIWLEASPEMFRRCAQNLITNALRYARSRVVLRYADGGDHTLLVVEDDGPGIPPAERDGVFEPFVRLDDSRSRKSGGVGLGLAIVSRIVKSHGGTVTIDEGELGGARFTTRWPCSTSPDDSTIG